VNVLMDKLDGLGTERVPDELAMSMARQDWRRMRRAEQCIEATLTNCECVYTYTKRMRSL